MCWHVMDGESRSFLVFAWALLAVFQSSHFHLPPSSSSLNTTAALGFYPSRITHVSPSNLPRYLLVLPRWSTSTSWRTWRLPSAIGRSSKQTTTPARSGKSSLDTRLPRLPSSCESTEPVSYQQSPQSTGSWHVVVLSHRHRRAHNQMLTSPCRCVPRRRLKDSTRRPMNTGAKSNPSPRCEQHQPAQPEKPPTTCSRWKSH